jgi:hypothetical protein
MTAFPSLVYSIYTLLINWPTWHSFYGLDHAGFVSYSAIEFPVVGITILVAEFGYIVTVNINVRTDWKVILSAWKNALFYSAHWIAVVQSGLSLLVRFIDTFPPLVIWCQNIRLRSWEFTVEYRVGGWGIQPPSPEILKFWQSWAEIVKVPKIKKILLYEIKFLVPNYSCLQNPLTRGLPPPGPLLSVLNLICWTPPQNKIPG